MCLPLLSVKVPATVFQASGRGPHNVIHRRANSLSASNGARSAASPEHAALLFTAGVTQLISAMEVLDNMKEEQRHRPRYKASWVKQTAMQVCRVSTTNRGQRKQQYSKSLCCPTAWLKTHWKRNITLSIVCCELSITCTAGPC